MHNKNISNWIRQSRYKAKKYSVYSKIEISEILFIIEHFNGKCAYCNKEDYSTIDHPFSIKDDAPCVAANSLPICKLCKSNKKNNDIITIFNLGEINEDRYLGLLKFMFDQPGGALVKEYVRQLTGHKEQLS